jgi:hypothetical protein
MRPVKESAIEMRLDEADALEMRQFPPLPRTPATGPDGYRSACPGAASVSEGTQTFRAPIPWEGRMTAAANMLMRR